MSGHDVVTPSATERDQPHVTRHMLARLVLLPDLFETYCSQLLACLDLVQRLFRTSYPITISCLECSTRVIYSIKTPKKLGYRVIRNCN